MRTYFTLVVKFGDQWSPEFGDYDHSVVKDERDTYDEEYETRILASGDTQERIDATVKFLNS